jgi:hypothetical protein
MKKKILISALFLTIGFAAAWANDRLAVQVSATSTPRNILSSELPTALRTDIKKEYKDYWITGLYEVVENKQPSYYITVENADQTIALSASDSQNWVIMSTTLKSI